MPGEEYSAQATLQVTGRDIVYNSGGDILAAATNTTESRGKKLLARKKKYTRLGGNLEMVMIARSDSYTLVIAH